MLTQIESANLLKNLHVKGEPLILFNIWDARSAQAMQEVGAKVIATSSWSVATAHGYEDGEKLPFDLALANLKRIIRSVNLPVTMDLESGYGKCPAEVQKNVVNAIEAGVAGINFEDQVIDGKELYAIADQCARIKAIRDVSEQMSIPLFINARTDIFLKVAWAHHNDHHLNEALQRAFAYAEAGANGFFAPGLRNAKYIEKLCELSPLPVNIMIMPDAPSSKHLTALGVARISYGPGPYRHLMDAVKDAGRKIINE